MLNLKTNEEMYNDYLEGVAYLESEVEALKQKIGRMKTDMDYKNDRINKLKETAEIYKPKSKTDYKIIGNIIEGEKITVDDLSEDIKIKISEYDANHTSITTTPATIHANESVLTKQTWTDDISDNQI